jgi:predicted regulator of Ras-like GTPase activity (Roadblock/LC7/MglB family)
MSSKEELAPKLEQIMSEIAVCEGLVLAKNNGEVIIGQTLTEMDHGSIAKYVSKIYKTKIDTLKKGKLLEMTLGMEEGFLIAVKNKDLMVLGFLGSDGKSSVGLLLRQLKNLMK